jgi:SAM-dependent methyltransferase
MKDYDATTYGDRIAPIYDALYDGVFDDDATVGLLAELAAGRPALELAIGTGRIALPLRRAGVEITGIDASEAMVAKLRAKPGGDDIDVVMGDFADVEVEGTFGLVFIVFNSLFALTSQQDQVRCFRNVADHLADDGVFLIEAFVPDTARFERHQTAGIDSVSVDEVIMEASRHDPVRQRVDGQHIVMRAGKPVELYPVSIRYAYPSELDLMARLAGLRLRDRWGGWQRESFTSESKFHVSLYTRA